MALNTLSSEDARHKRGHHKGQAAAWGNLVQVNLRKHKRQKQSTQAATIGNRQSQLLGSFASQARCLGKDNCGGDDRDYDDDRDNDHNDGCFDGYDEVVFGKIRY